MSSAATEQPTGSATTADAPVTRAEYCAVAVADAFAGDGEIHRQRHRHDPGHRRPPRPAHLRPRPAAHRR